MGLASQQKELSKFFCPFGQIFGVELRQFQLDVRLGNRSARLPTPGVRPEGDTPARGARADSPLFSISVTGTSCSSAMGTVLARG